MKEYEKAAYAHQTVARGLCRREDLARLFDRARPIYEARFGGLLPQARSARILDCPCGPGQASQFLRFRGYENVDSIDIDKNQVELAKLADIPAVVADAFEWVTQHVDTYDAIISIDFLEHLDKDSAMRFIQLCYGALNVGGVLILRMPCAEGPFFGVAAFNDITHRWVATSGVLRGLVEMCGFEEVRVFADAPVPYKWSNWIRLAAYRATCTIGSFWGQFAGLGAPSIWTPNMWATAVRKLA